MNKLIALVTMVLGLVAMSCAVGLSSHHPRSLVQTDEFASTVSRVHSVHVGAFASAHGVVNRSLAKSVSKSEKKVTQHCFSTELEQGGPGSVVRCYTM